MADYIEIKLDEYHTLQNRLNRYWKKLSIEAIKIAKERGLKTVAEETLSGDPRDITIILEGDDILNDSELLDLAKEKFPSLHRRYLEGNKKYMVLKLELETILDSI